MISSTITRLIEIKTYFAQACPPAQESFLGFPSWWKYLDQWDNSSGACVPILDFGTRPYEIWAIALAVLDMLLRVAGLAALIFIIIAGINFISSQGNPDEANKARQRIINAVIGLAVVFIAVPIVTFIGNRVG